MPSYSDSENYYGVPQSSLGVPQIIADPQGFAETPPPLAITHDPRGGFAPTPHYTASQRRYFNIPFDASYPGDRAFLMRSVIANQQAQLQGAGVPDSDPRMQALNTAQTIYGMHDDYSSLPDYPQGYINIPQTNERNYAPADYLGNWAEASPTWWRERINESGMTLKEAEDIVRRYYTPTSSETAYAPPPATYPLSRLRDVIFASSSGMN